MLLRCSKIFVLSSLRCVLDWMLVCSKCMVVYYVFFFMMTQYSTMVNFCQGVGFLSNMFEITTSLLHAIHQNTDNIILIFVLFFPLIIHSINNNELLTLFSLLMCLLIDRSVFYVTSSCFFFFWYLSGSRTA